VCSGSVFGKGKAGEERREGGRVAWWRRGVFLSRLVGGKQTNHTVITEAARIRLNPLMPVIWVNNSRPKYIFYLLSLSATNSQTIFGQICGRMHIAPYVTEPGLEIASSINL